VLPVAQALRLGRGLISSGSVLQEIFKCGNPERTFTRSLAEIHDLHAPVLLRGRICGILELLLAVANGE